MTSVSPRPLSGEMMASRIYSPFAYELVRHTRIVPVVACESERLGVAFPVVWRRTETGPELVVLRSLLEDGRGFPGGTAGNLGLLPLVLQAYPFLPLQGADEGAEKRRMIDDVVADRPSDTGATITNPDGRVSRGTELRLHVLEVFESDLVETRAIGRRIDALGLLEPWPLVFELGHDRLVEIKDLYVIGSTVFGSPRLVPVLAEFGASAARLLGIHRLSLFRAGALLAAAKATVAADVAGATR